MFIFKTYYNTRHSPRNSTTGLYLFGVLLLARWDTY